MKRLLIFAIAGCVSLGLAGDAQAARKGVLKIPALNKRVPATPVSKRAQIQRRLTVAANNQGLTPVPETPGSPIARVPVSLQTIPAAPQDGVPMEPNYTPVEVADPGVPMFENVRYVDCHEKAPCAKPKVIVVRDPCQRANTSPCCRRCVAITICVPDCGCECVKVNRQGTRIRYDYGEYAVNVRVLNGRIVVNYAD